MPRPADNPWPKEPVGNSLTPIQQTEREDAIAEWLVRHQLDPDYATSLANTAITMDTLETLAKMTKGEKLEAAICWIAAKCETNTLAVDIEKAATQIYELVTAVKKFTHLDNLAGAEFVDVEPGIRDTIRILTSKEKSKNAVIKLEIEKNIPRVKATGSVLNQIWMNLFCDFHTFQTIFSKDGFKFMSL